MPSFKNIRVSLTKSICIWRNIQLVRFIPVSTKKGKCLLHSHFTLVKHHRLNHIPLYLPYKMTEEIGEAINWTTELEDYFVKTAERSHGLAWLHKRAESTFARKRNFIDLPVIVISSAVGFLQVGSTSMFGSDTSLASTLLGIGSLFVSVLNTTGTYFGFSKRAEGHRISAIQYNRLYRFLSVEMSLPRESRMSPRDLLKYTRDAYDRLDEISPLVPSEIINEFQKKFGKLNEIAKPEIANGLEKVTVYTNPLLNIVAVDKN